MHVEIGTVFVRNLFTTHPSIHIFKEKNSYIHKEFISQFEGLFFTMRKDI